MIIFELTSGVICLVGGCKMLVNYKKDEMFNNAKAIFIIGATVALAVWYFGFCVIASEWFAMWANKTSAQPIAYSISAILLLSLIYISMRDS